MAMNDMIKYGLIAGAGYFLYLNRAMLFAGTAAAVDPTKTTSTAPTGPSQTTLTTRALMNNYLVAHPGTLPSTGVMNYDQWGWVYTQARGVAAPAPPGEPFDRAANLTMDEFFNLQIIQGLGQIVRLDSVLWGY